MNVFITGAAGGLGRAFAAECGRRGYNMLLTDVNADALESLKRGLENRFDVSITSIPCELTDSDSVDMMFKKLNAFGVEFDMLLNIAGLDFEGSFADQDREKLVKIVTLNDAATLSVTHAMLLHRRIGKPFYMVFVSSLASLFPMPLKATYAASKRFLYDFATSLRQELRDDNVNILTLCPGGMATKDDTVEAIEAQGFWGYITTNPLESVTSETLDRVFNDKAVYIPGKFNRLLATFGKLLPRHFIAYCVFKRWSYTQQKWLTHKANLSGYEE